MQLVPGIKVFEQAAFGLEHFREALERHGLPEAIYTDALSLFGPSSSNHHADPRSEFQRALRALHVAHLVAPTPRAKGKGKIERSFQTFQNRLVTLMAHAKVSDWKSNARAAKPSAPPAGSH